MGVKVEGSISGVVPSMIRTISANPNQPTKAGNLSKHKDSIDHTNAFEASVNSNVSFESTSSLTSLSAAFSENKIANSSCENLPNDRHGQNNQRTLVTEDQNEKNETQSRKLANRKSH